MHTLQLHLREIFCMTAGMMWLWDLSSCLGWQKGGPTGLWMQDSQVTTTLAVHCPDICIQSLCSMHFVDLLTKFGCC